MLEKIEKIFKDKKVISIEDLKESLNIESAKEFVELVKNVGKLERKLVITQLPNEKFLYVKEGLEIDIFEPDYDEQNNRDDIVASGFVTECVNPLYKQVKWCCKIDKKGIKHISDE